MMKSSIWKVHHQFANRGYGSLSRTLLVRQQQKQQQNLIKIPIGNDIITSSSFDGASSNNNTKQQSTYSKPESLLTSYNFIKRPVDTTLLANALSALSITTIPIQSTSSIRLLSTSTSIVPSGSSVSSTDQQQPQLVTTDDGRQIAAITIDKRAPKLKPSIIKRRLLRMKTYVGSEKNIRHSPWRLNLICQLIVGLPVLDALQQLEYCQKRKAPLVQKVVQRTCNLADIKDGFQLSQLEIAECFVTKGRSLKRVKPMGRGRSGKMEHKHAHIRLVVRQIDFKIRIYLAKTLGEKKRWTLLQFQAQQDYNDKLAERQQEQQLEKQIQTRTKK